MDKYNFQNCQKIVVVSKDENEVLLAKRKKEADYDGVFSFTGGKMETSDPSIIEGLKREKNEEVGKDFKIKIHPKYCINVLFTKKDGNRIILPHYYAIYVKGDIKLSEEYSEYKWVELNKLDSFEPKIPNIPEIIKELQKLRKILTKDDFVII